MPRLAHKQIKVLSSGGLIKKRQAFGIFSSNIVNNIFFYNNTMSVALRALTERLYYVKGKDGFVPCPKPTAPFSTLHHISEKLRRCLPDLPPVWTVEQFIQSYAGSKRKRYEAAAANLALRGLRRRDGNLSTFIKAELYDGTIKEDPCPRLIQPRTPEYNIAIGVFLRPLEKLVYKGIDRMFGHHVVLKCDNPWKRAETIVKYWHEFNEPVYVGLDASRFDQHTSAEALEFEHSFYNRLFKSRWLAELLSWQVDQVGYANMVDGSIKYTVRGCRASGDMNTALGNVFLMCTITYNFLTSLPCKWRFINDGDDCGIFIERRDLPLLDSLPQHHLAYGYEMEIEAPASCIEQIEFCQSRPVQLNESSWMMVRNIHKAMRHDWISVTSRNYATMEENFVATARCGLALYADVPVLSSMYLAMSQFKVRENVVQRILAEEHSGIGRTWRLFSSEKRMFPVDETIARVSIWKAFGLLPDSQVALEEQFRAFKLEQNLPQFSLFYSSPKARVQYLLNHG